MNKKERILKYKIDKDIFFYNTLKDRFFTHSVIAVSIILVLVVADLKFTMTIISIIFILLACAFNMLVSIGKMIKKRKDIDNNFDEIIKYVK